MSFIFLVMYPVHDSVIVNPECDRSIGMFRIHVISIELIRESETSFPPHTMSAGFRITPALWDKIHHFASFPQTGGQYYPSARSCL